MTARRPAFVSGRRPLAKSLRRGNQQYAALPIRVTQECGIEVLLITSRGTKRWIIPKGWPMKKYTPAEAAAALVAEAPLGRIIRTVPALCRRKKIKRVSMQFMEQNGAAPGVLLRPTRETST